MGLSVYNGERKANGREREMSSIFTRIVRGEVPSYKIYEDDKTFAFLDIAPETAGHVLVVPKVEVDKVYELPEDDYVALWDTVRKLARHMDEVLAVRILIKVVGTDVPHAHVHLMPYDAGWRHGRVLRMTETEMLDMAGRLRLD